MGWTMSHILIVDDSIVIRKVLCRIFDGLNFKAHQADTREHAFDICTKYAPDIIIIDWLIPSDGAVSLVRALRKLPQCAHTRFFVCSALFTS